MKRSWYYVLGAVAVAVALVLAGRKLFQDRTATPGAAAAEITPLEGTLEPLRAFFNANQGRHRFVALLSPT